MALIKLVNSVQLSSLKLSHCKGRNMIMANFLSLP